MDDSQPSVSVLDLRDGQAFYFFALAATDELDVSVPGMDEETPVQTVPCGPWTAVVDAVDQAAWTGEEADANMQTLTWVGPRAVRHEEVVEAVMEAAPVFPARFGTLFSSAAELRERIDAHAGALSDFFDLVAGREEWSVKGFVDREVAQEVLAGASDDASSGTDYLQQRKRVQDARADVEDWLDDLADDLHERLADACTETVTLDPGTRPDTSGDAVFHWAVLGDDDAIRAVRAVVQDANDAHADRGLTLELNGPWPPYNFRPADDGASADLTP